MPDKLTEQSIQNILDEYTRTKPLNVVSEDATGCCAAIRKDLRDKPIMIAWTCPKCGLSWLPREDNGMRIWEAFPLVMVWKR